VRRIAHLLPVSGAGGWSRGRPLHRIIDTLEYATFKQRYLAPILATKSCDPTARVVFVDCMCFSRCACVLPRLEMPSVMESFLSGYVQRYYHLLSFKHTFKQKLVLPPPNLDAREGGTIKALRAMLRESGLWRGDVWFINIMSPSDPHGQPTIEGIKWGEPINAGSLKQCRVFADGVCAFSLFVPALERLMSLEIVSGRVSGLRLDILFTSLFRESQC